MIVKTSYVFILCFILNFSCSKKNEIRVAKVDDHGIFLTAFKVRYQDFLANQIQDDNLMNRYLFLNNVIDETLFLKYAHELSINDEEDYLKKKEDIENQLLLNEYFNKKVNIDFIPTNSEIRNLYKWQNTTIHVRHLFSRDKNKINELKKRLNLGADWEGLAYECFQDSTLKNNGGDLGWHKYGELDTRFEIKAFALKPGEISEPIKTKDGYSIIQLIESELQGFLIEDDYQSRKNKLIELAKNVRQKKNLIDLTDETLQSMNVNFDEKVLDNLYQLLQSKQKSIEPFYNDKLVSFDNKNWNVFQSIEQLSDLSLRQLSRIDSPFYLKEALLGLIVRESFLNDSKKANLHKSKSFIDQLDKHLNQYLVSYVMKKLEITSPTDSLIGQEKIRERYFSFRNQLALEANILIDSVAIKTFIM
jgi:parvulin-like peptidyl-prolyl isomerase